MRAGNTYARFRLSSAGGLGPAGLAADGEVEDYEITLVDDSTPQPVTVNLPNDGNQYEAVLVGTNVVVQKVGGGGILFQAPLNSVSGLTVQGTSAADKFTVDYATGGYFALPINFNGGVPPPTRATNWRSKATWEARPKLPPILAPRPTRAI